MTGRFCRLIRGRHPVQPEGGLPAPRPPDPCTLTAQARAFLRPGRARPLGSQQVSPFLLGAHWESANCQCMPPPRPTQWGNGPSQRGTSGHGQLGGSKERQHGAVGAAWPGPRGQAEGRVPLPAGVPRETASCWGGRGACVREAPREARRFSSGPGSAAKGRSACLVSQRMVAGSALRATGSPVPSRGRK